MATEHTTHNRYFSYVLHITLLTKSGFDERGKKIEEAEWWCKSSVRAVYKQINMIYEVRYKNYDSFSCSSCFATHRFVSEMFVFQSLFRFHFYSNSVTNFPLPVRVYGVVTLTWASLFQSACPLWFNYLDWMLFQIQPKSSSCLERIKWEAKSNNNSITEEKKTDWYSLKIGKKETEVVNNLFYYLAPIWLSHRNKSDTTNESETEGKFGKWQRKRIERYAS